MSEVIIKLTSDHIKVKGGEYVRDLVRCKECIWFDTDNTGEDYCMYVKGLADANADDFCSYGVRKGADDE